MARFRVYPSKNSVIFEDYPLRNVGVNPVFELWYGLSGVTRSISKWDFTDYVALYNEGIAPALSSTTVDDVRFVFSCPYPILERDIAIGDAAYVLEFVSGSVIDFQEGLGFDHDTAFINMSVVNDLCDWNSANTITPWQTSGVFEDSQYGISALADRDAETILFTCNTVNATYLWDEQIQQNNSMLSLVKFSDAYEALTGSTTKKKLFYSRHTNTALQPYIQIDWDNTVTEDRADVVEGITSSLYLFMYKNNELADPASVDSVTILGNTDSNIEHISTGIYKYDYVLPIGSGGTGTVITDTWNITYTGALTGTVVQTFTGVSIGYSNLWSGDTNMSAQQYSVSVPNLDLVYTKGDRVYVRVKFKKQYSSVYTIVKNAEYRVHIPNGDSEEPQLIMYDWEPMSYRDENFFIMFTEWFLTGQTYQIDIRYGDGQSQVVDTVKRRFTVQ